MKKAISFIENNKNSVDILFLHDNFIEYTDNKNNISNTCFTRDYGFLAHVYIVTRKYIKSILDKNNNHLPQPSKIHFDIDISMEQKSVLYSKNIYYCKKSVFIQKNNSEWDNYNNILDEIIRKKYGNYMSFHIGIQFIKHIKLLLKDDYKTQRVFMRLSKLYVK